MKPIKKLASVVLALIMVLAMTVTAFAAGNGKITVDNPVAGQTYTAYKIFDVTYDTNKSTYAYSIAGDSEWFAAVKAYADTEGKGLTLTKAASENTYAVTIDNSFKAADFAAALKQAATRKNGTPLTGDKPTATGLDLGYYFVTSTSGAICNLTTTNPDVTIHDKNDVTFEKTDDKADVEVGEVVNYTITGKVPDTTGFTEYTYEINDTMSKGLTFNKDVKVYVDGQEISANYTVDYTGTDDTPITNGFKLTIDVMQLQNDATKAIEVKYSATVNDDAVTVISKNHATLTYSNDPNETTSKKTTPPDEEIVYSAKIVINKYETGNDSKKLAGAQFVLMNNEGKYYKYTPAAPATKAAVTWVDNQDDATVVTTDENGAGAFAGLKNGTYTLKEIKAPEGYNLLKDTIEITFANQESTFEGQKIDVEVPALKDTENVGNNTGTELPETGGIGTTIFYVVGGMLVLGAAVLLVVKKRMKMEMK